MAKGSSDIPVSFNEKFYGFQIHKLEYLHFRTSSFEFEGERSDLHDVMAISYAALLRISDLNISTGLISFANDFGADGEVDSNVLHIIQTGDKYNKLHDFVSRESRLASIILEFQSYFWEELGCPCPQCLKELNNEDIFKFDMPSKIAQKFQSAFGKEGHLQYSRRHPDWYYYRDATKGIILVQSSKLANLLTFYAKVFKYDPKMVQGISGEILISGNVKNIIPSSKRKFITRIFQQLEDTSKPLIIPIENYIISVGKDHVLAVYGNSGIEAFKIEREKIRTRHSKESELLFPPIKFVWSEKIDPDSFEKMVRDLLSREANVKWVRKSGNTREQDQGRDLMIDISLTEPEITATGIKQREFRVVGQCKAFKGKVSKSNVTDIRDTIENHNCDGYFLIVSGYVTSQLGGQLEKMRAEKKYWINWWGRDEIEERLIKNDDIVAKYSNIVKPIISKL